LVAASVRGGGQVLEITDYYPIRSMILPTGWVEEPTKPNIWHGPFGRKFYPPEQPKAYLMLRCPNYPTPPHALAAWRKIVRDIQPHDLSLEELKELNWYFEYLIVDTEFEPFVARTEDWSERRVVVLEGRLLKLGLTTYSLYAEMMLAWECVMQITYDAPPEFYAVYLDAARESLRSIRWKPDRGVLAMLWARLRRRWSY
jgi:hypothetical protein